jgi:hypothetical protein
MCGVLRLDWKALVMTRGINRDPDRDPEEMVDGIEGTTGTDGITGDVDGRVTLNDGDTGGNVEFVGGGVRRD